MSRTIVVIQSRRASVRLPGKALADLAGYALIWHVVVRAQAIQGVDEVILTTPPEDAPALLAAVPEVRWVAHHPPDVLSGFKAAATLFDAGVVVRITGDCPLHDPALAAEALRVQRNRGYDYVGTTRPDFTMQYPDGLDVEVIARSALEAAHDEARGEDREHVTAFVWRELERFRVYGMRPDPRWDGARAIKLSVDDADDLARVRAVLAQVPPGEYSLVATLTAAEEVTR